MSSAAEPISAHLCSECDAEVAASAATCRECDALRPRGGWRLDPHLGRVIADRYRLIERIGKGGIGRVYRANDVSEAGELGSVVVKLLADGGGAVENRRFANEARAARALTNPHAVKIYDFGFYEGSPYLVMELLRGKTVRELLTSEGPLEPERAVDIALQICRALGEAHAAGIVHRDLKPENLLLLAPEHRFVKVLDFGAARLSGIDATRSVIGTPRYMSPEQILEQELDGRADVYALGACLFEMLLGRPPFESKTLAGCVNAHLNEPVPKVREHSPALSPALALLIERMLAKQPADRPSSMADVEQALMARKKPRVLSATLRRRWAVAAGVLLVSGASTAWLAAPRVEQAGPVGAQAPAPPPVAKAAGLQPMTTTAAAQPRSVPVLRSPRALANARPTKALPSASASAAPGPGPSARSGTLAEHEF